MWVAQNFFFTYLLSIYTEITIFGIFKQPKQYVRTHTLLGLKPNWKKKMFMKKDHISKYLFMWGFFCKGPENLKK